MHPLEQYIEAHPVLIGLLIAAAPFLVPAFRRLLGRGWKSLAGLFLGNSQVLAAVAALNDKIDAVDGKVQAVDGKVKSVQDQVQTNGGSSLKDSVLRTENALKQVIAAQVRFENYRQDDFWTRNRPGLELDGSGLAILASEAACHLFKVSDPDELLNHSWLRFLDAHHVDTFTRSFRDTSATSSIFSFTIRIKDKDRNDRGEWEFKATPIDVERAKRYSGFFSPVDAVAKEIAGRAGWSG